MISDFQFLKKLGEGSFSSVYLVKRSSDGQLYALKKVKLLSLSEKEKQNALNEVRLLASFDHPYVIGFKQAFIDDPTSTLCLVMEHAENGDILSKVQEHIRRGTYFKEQDIWNYFGQMIIGLKALHDLKICHRDIKCANIFMNSKGQTKLGDFNVSKVAKRGMLYTQTGTPYYASPEVWKDRPYDYKSDIWSVGCVLYEMIALRPPFKAPDMKGLYRKVVAVDYPPIPGFYSADLSVLLRYMLQGNPSLRMSCDQLLQLQLLSKKVTHPSVQEAIKESVQNSSSFKCSSDDVLLNTIKLPRIIKNVQDQLPKSNYQRQLSQPTRLPHAGNNSNPLTPTHYININNENNKHQRPISGKMVLQKHPSLNQRGLYEVKAQQKNGPSHQYYDDQFNSNENKENINNHYLRYKKASKVVRKSAEPTAQRPNRVSSISNIVEGVERKINDVLSSVERAQANYQYNRGNQGYQPSNPYGCPVGGIAPVPSHYLPSSRNVNVTNVRSHNLYSHLR